MDSLEANLTQNDTGYSDYDFNNTEMPWCPSPYRDFTQKILHFYVIPVTCAIGLTTNILALVIFYFMKRSSSAYFLLKFVAVLDSVNLIRDVLFPHLAHYLWCAHFAGYSWVATFMYSVTGSLSLIPFWIILLISFDRYMHVCQPFLSRRINVERIVRIASFIVCIVLFLAFLILNIIRFHFYQGRAPKIYSSVVITIGGILPFPVIAAFNFLVILGMRKAQRHIGLKGTVMILTMTISFLLLKIPMTVMTIGNRFSVSLFSNTMVSITLYLDTVNFSLNFWLYVATGKKFRSTLLSLLARVTPLRLRRLSISSSSSRKTSESKIEHVEMASTKDIGSTNTKT